MAWDSTKEPNDPWTSADWNAMVADQKTRLLASNFRVENINNVDLTSLQDGQVLVYNSTTGNWENQDRTSGMTSLNDLNDVDLSTPSDNDLLSYNSGTSDWENISKSTFESSIDHGNLSGLTDDDHTQYLKADGTRALAGDWSLGGYNLTNGGYIDIGTFADGSEPAFQTGRIFYSSANSVLSFYDGTGEVDVSEEMTLRAKNLTGGTVNKGDLVYISGSSGSNPNFKLAKADTLPTSQAVGMAKDTISSNAAGKILTFGRISGIDTSAYSDGTCLYLSATTAGAYTDIPPEYPNYRIRIGTVIKSDSSIGSLFLEVNRNTADDRIDDRVNDILSAGSNLSKTYDDAANTLTIDYTGPTSLSGLDGTDISSPTDSQVLTYNGTSGLWENQDATSGITTLSGLSDTNISSVTGGEILTYDGANSEWINQTLNEAGLIDTAGNALTKTGTTLDVDETAIATSNLNNDAGFISDITGENFGDLSNVSFSSLSSNDIVRYNGTNFVNVDFDTEVSNNTDVSSNTTHRTSDGTDHTFIDQDVTTTASPTFSGVTTGSFGYDYAEGTVNSIGNLGSSYTFDWSVASHYTGTLDADVTLDFSNTTVGQKKTFLLSYDGSAQRTITWTPTIKWIGGSAPTTPSSSGEVLVVTVFYDGTNYIGSGDIAS